MNIRMGIITACLLITASVSAQHSETRRQRHTTREEQKQTSDKQQSTPKGGAHLRIYESTYNFGDVMRKGGNLNHDIKVENDGTAPLVITRVVTSCSCLKAAFPKRPIPAGQSAVIRITYEPLKSEPGAFHKVLQVYSNSTDGRQLITVQGNSLDPNKK